jgi:NAD+ kinase
METFYIVYNPDKDDDAQVLARLRDYIQEKNCVSGYMDCYSFSALGKDEVVRVLSGYDCILVLGGDGTLLNAASTVSHVDVPLFGINLGTVGFLTEGEVTNLAAIMERLLSDDFSIQERMMVRGSVRSGNNAVLRKRALNDIVISRAGFSRLIGLDVYVNGSFLNAYEGDGIIISTPTGSTGYNLSAGGPIVDPMAQLMIITPVCPHSLTSKSIVLPSDAEVSIAIAKKRKTQETEAIVSFDGGNDLELSAGDILDICVSKRTTKLIKASDVNFYEILRNKLGGK